MIFTRENVTGGTPTTNICKKAFFPIFLIKKYRNGIENILYEVELPLKFRVLTKTEVQTLMSKLQRSPLRS